MTFLCFAPVQVVKSFVRDRDIELLSRLRAARGRGDQIFRARSSLEDADNLALAFVATYTFANGMLLWGLAWPTTRA